jgi:hypothetical protein
LETKQGCRNQGKITEREARAKKKLQRRGEEKRRKSQEESKGARQMVRMQFR